MEILIIIASFSAFNLLALTTLFYWQNKKSAFTQNQIKTTLIKEYQEIKNSLFENILHSQKLVNESLRDFSQQSHQTHQQGLVHLQTTLRENFMSLDKQIQESLTRSTAHLSTQFDKLNHNTQAHLLKISESVEIKLAKGFEKTNETFTNIITRLAMIDDAQKKMTDLSKNVVSLQEILSDKRSRGAFGEVQLNTLIQNVLPNNSYALQHTLASGARVDCLLLLPPPTGKIAIDAKFPLENYKRFADHDNNEGIRIAAKQQFKLDIKKHIQDISQKYIVEGETSDGAIMFIPAEAIFAEIHAHHPDLVEFAWQARVWMASPSTMMAILTTACAVLKDSATRQQVHVIQDHLRLLAQDFTRFEKRMDNLSRHLQQANSDAEQVHTSAQKITKRFHQIENVELSNLENLEEAAPLDTHAVLID